MSISEFSKVVQNPRDLPPTATESFSDEQTDAILLKINDQIIALEEGNRSSFNPICLEEGIAVLRDMIQKISGDPSINEIEGHLIMARAMRDAIENYLDIAKEVLEAYGEGGDEIRSLLNKVEEKPFPLGEERGSFLTELFEGLRHPIKTLFPSLEERKAHLKEQFFDEMKKIHFAFKGFKFQKGGDLRKQTTFEKRALQKEPPEMSEGRKQLWRTVFTALQLGSDLIKIGQRDSIAALMGREKRRIPLPPLTKKQEKSAAFVANMLGIKLDILREYTDAEFIQMTNRFPETRPFLEPYRKSQGAVDPAQAMEEYIATLDRGLRFFDWVSDGRWKSNETNGAPKPDQEEESWDDSAPFFRSASKEAAKGALTRETGELAAWVASPSLQVDQRLLAHLLGENFAMKSGLEGYPSEAILSFLYEALVQKRRIDKSPSPFYDKAIPHLAKALEFAQIFQRKDFETLITKMRSEMEQLQVGESFIFQSYYVTSETSGHAIVMEVFRESETSFGLRIFNSGDGLNYHNQVIVGESLHHARDLEIAGIHPDRLANRAFCQSLLNLQEKASSGAWSARDVYAALTPHLEGQVNAKPITIHSVSKTHQTGFCAYLSLEHWMRDLAPQEFDSWHIQLQLKAFVDFAAHPETRSERVRKLIQKSGEQLERNAQEAFDKGIIQQEDWAFIQKKIGETLSSYAPTIGKDSLQVVPFKGVAENREMALQIESKDPVGSAVELLGMSDWHYDPTNFVAEAGRLRELFRVENEKGNHRIVKEAILEWIEKIPFQRRAELFKILLPDQAEKLLETMAEVAKDYLFSLSKIPVENFEQNASPRQALAMIKLLTLGHALSRSFEQNGMVHLPGLYQKEMDLILEGSSGSNHFFDPKLEEDARKLKAYWSAAEPKQRRKEISFFGFEYVDPYYDEFKFVEATRRNLFEDKIPPRSWWAYKHHLADFEWPDIEWAKRYIQKNNLQHLIVQANPVLAEKPLSVQAFSLLCDRRESFWEETLLLPRLLPPSFYHLFDLSYAVQLGVTGVSLRKEKNEHIRATGIENECRVDSFQHDHVDYVEWKKEIRPFGRELQRRWFVREKKGVPHPVDPNSQLKLVTKRADLTLANFVGDLGMDHQNLYTSLIYLEESGSRNERKRIAPNQRVLRLPKDEDLLTLSLEEMREQLALSADPRLQVRETFAYYSRRSELLENKKDQILFAKLFFEPFLLLQFLKEGSPERDRFIAKFENFYRKGFQTYADLGLPLVASFYLDIGAKFERALNHLGLKSSQREPFPFGRHLRGLIERGFHKVKEAAFLYLDLLTLQRADALDEQGAIDALEAQIRLAYLPLPERHRTKKIRTSSLGDSGSYKTYQEQTEEVWGFNPLFPFEKASLAKDHLIRLREPLAKLLRGERGDRILNQVMRNLDPLFQDREWVGNPEFPFFATKDRTAFINVLEGTLYSKTGSLKPLPKELYKHPAVKPLLKDSPEPLGFEVAPGVYEFHGHEGAMRGVLEWMKIRIQKEVEGVWMEKIFPFGSLPKVLQENDDHWLSLESDKLQIGKKYEAQIVRGEITHLANRETGAHLARPSSLMSRIEDPEYILQWIDPATKETTQIEFPRLGLIFDVDGEKRVASSRFPGYKLSSNQHLLSLGDLENYLVLEKGGEKLILMSLDQRSIRPESALRTDQPFEQSNKGPLLAYSVDPKGRLIPKDSLSRLYLSYLKLSEQEYEEAWSYLVGSDSDLRPLSRKETEILEWMIDEKGQAQDRDPRAVAIRLKGQLLLMRNQDHVPGLEERTFSPAHYTDLIQRGEVVPERFRPNPEEKRRLQRYFRGKETPQIAAAHGLFSGQFLGTPKEEEQLFNQAREALHDPKPNLLSPKELSSGKRQLLKTHPWNQNFIRKAYEAIRASDQGNLAEVHAELYGSSPLIPIDSAKLAREIREALLIVVRSSNQGNERALAALLLGVMEAPQAFPEFAPLLASVTELESRDRIAAEKGAEWLRVNYSPAVSLFADKYLQFSSSLPPITLVGRPLKALPHSWQGESTRLPSPFVVPDMPIENPSQAALIGAQLAEREEMVLVDLLREANRLEETALGQLAQIGDFISGNEKPIELDDLLKLFLTFDTEALHHRNRALTQEDCHRLFRKTGEYLVLATQRQHLERISRKYQELQRSSGVEKERIEKELQAISSQQRGYSPSEHPEYLLLEFAKNIRLRQSQVDAIEKFTPGTAQEMIMGSGKTMVLLPLLALKAADGENLSMIAMPQDLIQSMGEELDQTLGGAFGKSIDLFYFNRDVPLTVSNLERIYERLKRAIEKRRVVAMSGSDLQSLFLLAIESFHDNRPTAPLYRKILSLMKKSGRLILDEMHMVLDILQAHHFSSGQKIPLNRVETEETLFLFNILSSLGWSGEKALSPIRYENEFKGKIVERILAERFEGLNKGVLKSYLLEKGGEQAERYVERIQSSLQKDQLATLKEQINRVLPLVLGKQIDEHFGPVPPKEEFHGDSRRIAIPYQGSQKPSTHSQFGSSLETSDYTVLLHLVIGIETEVVAKELERIKVQVQKEMEEGDTKNLEEAPTYQRFLTLGGEKSFPLLHLKPEEIELIRQRINRDPLLKLELIGSWILPELRVYPRQLATNGHILPLLVQSIRGFSGTNWNSHTFPKAFVRRLDSDTVSRTLGILRSKEAPLLLYPTPREFRNIATSVADRGGVFRGMENEEIARDLLSSSSAKGIVFYKENELRVLLKGDPNSIPYAACPLPKEALIALWDQRHTTGSDIPLGASAQAVVTVGRHTHLYELLQSVWRLRQLDHHQRVQFALLEEEADFMAQMLQVDTGRDPKEPLRAEDLFEYCRLKQMKRSEEDASRALLFKLRSEMIKPILAEIFDQRGPLPSPEVLEELFYLHTDRSPYERQGKIGRAMRRDEYIKTLIEGIRSTSLFNSLPLATQKEAVENMEALGREALPLLPLYLSSTASQYETEVKIQTELQTEEKVEQKTEIKTETQTETEKVNEPYFNPREWYSSRGVVSWEGALTPSDFIPTPMTTLEKTEFQLAPTYSLTSFREKGITPVSRLDEELPFDPALTATTTFTQTLKETENPGQAEAVPRLRFGRTTDILQEALLIRDPQTGKIQMLLVTQTEAKEFLERVKKEEGVQLALYHLYDGYMARGASFPEEELLERDPHFMRLKVQAKFYHGEIRYSKEELNALEVWLHELGYEKLIEVRKIFEEEILKWKEVSKQKYPYSKMKKLFDKVEASYSIS